MGAPVDRNPDETLRFALTFGALFALLYGSFEWLRDSPVVESLLRAGILSASAALIDWISPAEAVRAVGHNLVSAGSRLHVTRGCEGVEMFLLLTAGMLAFPARPRYRLQGLLVGFSLAYVLTLARLLALHFTLRYRPAAWEALHGLFLPLGPVVLIALYFLWWTGKAPGTMRRNRAADAP